MSSGAEQEQNYTEENSFQLSVPSCSHTENINTAEERRLSMKLVGSEGPGARTATAAQARSPLRVVVAALPHRAGPSGSVTTVTAR